MERKKISTDLTVTAYLLIGIGLLLFASGLAEIKNVHAAAPIWKVLPGLCVAALGIYVFGWPKKIEFDDADLYITKRTTESSIPLTRIYKVQFLRTRFYHRFAWKICYSDSDGSDKTVRVLPNKGNINFEIFLKQLKKVHPSASISTWSHSFDFNC